MKSRLKTKGVPGLPIVFEVVINLKHCAGGGTAELSVLLKMTVIKAWNNIAKLIFWQLRPLCHIASVFTVGILF